MSKMVAGGESPLPRVDVGPHRFERLSWLRPRSCARCLLPKSDHPRHFYSPARSWNSRDAARARSRRVACYIAITLAALALLLFAALPAGGQELTDKQAAVVRSLERIYPPLGLSAAPNASPEQQRWHQPSPGQAVPWREWLARWYPGGYTAWTVATKAHSEGCHLIELDLGEVAQHSASLAPWVYRDARGRPTVDTRLMLPGEARLCGIWRAWNAATFDPPPLTEGCDLGGWSAEPVLRETCTAFRAGNWSSRCCSSTSGGFGFGTEHKRICVNRPACFLGGEPPVDPEEPPVDPPDPPVDPVDPEPPVDPPVAECDLSAVEARLAALESEEDTRHAALLLELDALEATTRELHREALRVTLDRMLLLLSLLRQEIQAVGAQCQEVSP